MPLSSPFGSSIAFVLFFLWRLWSAVLSSVVAFYHAFCCFCAFWLFSALRVTHCRSFLVQLNGKVSMASTAQSWHAFWRTQRQFTSMEVIWTRLSSSWQKHLSVLQRERARRVQMFKVSFAVLEICSSSKYVHFTNNWINLAIWRFFFSSCFWFVAHFLHFFRIVLRRLNNNFRMPSRIWRRRIIPLSLLRSSCCTLFWSSAERPPKPPLLRLIWIGWRTKLLTRRSKNSEENFWFVFVKICLR